MKIVDCFVFYDELEMLLYKLEVLYDVVDYFVLVEAEHTFTGKPKPLYYKENEILFKKYQDKIMYVSVHNMPIQVNENETVEKKQIWDNEYYQRNCIVAGLNHLSLNNDDIIIVSDIDEITDPETIKKIKKGDIVVTMNSLEQDFYYYNLESKKKFSWYYAKIVNYNLFKDSNLSTNEIRWMNLPPIAKGGWHLSYFGDEKSIKNKIENFAHQELNQPFFTNEERIKERKKQNRDLFDREGDDLTSISINENSYLPPFFERWLHLHN